MRFYDSSDLARDNDYRRGIQLHWQHQTSSSNVMSEAECIMSLFGKDFARNTMRVFACGVESILFCSDYERDPFFEWKPCDVIIAKIFL